ncbi:hypothetical protein EIP91_010902 [Steccherinum ochraceum]|uniref:Transmembrane protein n=1 Tax=Steccherinum ochraceum TaxID=92696 RepID=A0A4R0RMX7_9APHY|nr:hypothetical protein EIP91_010902 [Steccherinum ochraceum]
MSSSSTFSSTTTRTIFGTWSNASTSSLHIDLEAQIITGTRTLLPLHHELPSPPSAAVPTRRSSDSLREEAYDPIDLFFGVNRSRGTRDSRHDELASPIYIEADEVAPPPYADASDLPSYTAVAEPPTLAMYLFQFGFLFPLLWLAGIVVLLSPLAPPSEWEATKPEAERRELVELLRRTEVKWAKRCLYAFTIFALAATMITVTVVLNYRS